MYYSCIYQARVHANETREMLGKTRVLMQTKMHEATSTKSYVSQAKTRVGRSVK